MPKVSVVMPAYNAEKYIGEAIESILNQTFTDFEFIIVDDCSKDKTADIVNSYSDKRIRFYQNDKNMGVATTLNRGLDLATGEYIARMDSDDISLPERFEKQVAYMSAHPECAVCGTDIELFGAKRGVFAHSGTAELLKVDSLFASPLAHPTVMMRSSVIGALGMHYDGDYNGIEDYELWIRVTEKYDLGNLNEILFRYRIHPAQVTQNYSDDYLKKIFKLKKRQMEALSIQNENAGFGLFVDFCNGKRKFESKEIQELLSFFKMIEDNNIRAKIFDCKALSKSFVGVRYSLLSSVSIKDASNILSCAGLNWYGYVAKRVCRGAMAKGMHYITTKINNVKLRNKDFTIISNNCWGGIISEKYGLRKNSPTCGLLIMGSDYVKFCKDLNYYVKQKLRFFPMNQAKYYENFKKNTFPVAMLDDIEIYFMHYKTEALAAEKWYRRCERINWDNIIYKISEKKTFSPEIMESFVALPLENRLIFAARSYSDDTIIVKDIDKLEVDETPFVAEVFDEVQYLNSIKNKRS